MAFLAVITISGVIHKTGLPGGGGGGGSGSVKSVPATWSLARSGGHSSTGTGGKTRTSAVPCVTVMPGSRAARSHAAPLARRTTLRMRASSQARIAAAHSPSPLDRGSLSSVKTARAVHSSASVRAGGAARSTRTTSGSAYWSPASRAASCIAGWPAVSRGCIPAEAAPAECVPAGAVLSAPAVAEAVLAEAALAGVLAAAVLSAAAAVLREAMPVAVAWVAAVPAGPAKLTTV